jgi:Zn-dependent protease
LYYNTKVLIFILAFLVALTIHEAAHALVADKLGDPTPRLAKRLTLNPIAHLDLYGTILVPFVLLFIGSPFVFGWAKPVPIDPYNLAHPKKDSALISLAGPLANIILATLLAIFWRFGLGNELTFTLIRFNVVLAVFNLIPVHPLDGGKVLVGLLPAKEAHELDMFLTRYGTLILLFLIFPLFGGSSLIFQIISPIINLVMNLLIPFHTV